MVLFFGLSKSNQIEISDRVVVMPKSVDEVCSNVRFGINWDISYEAFKNYMHCCDMSVNQGLLITGLSTLVVAGGAIGIRGSCVASAISAMGFGAANAVLRINVRYVPITFGVPRSRLSEIIQENLASSEYGVHQFEIGELTSNAIASGNGSMGNISMLIYKLVKAKRKRTKLMYAVLIAGLTLCRLALRIILPELAYA